MSADSLDDDDRLGLLVGAVLSALEAQEVIDEIALAARFRLDPAVVADCVVGLRAVQDYSWDFHDDGKAPAPSHKRPELPLDYELLEEIGRGGMGVVYRARQRSLGREVAVKVLRPGDVFLEQALQRFEKEARSLARLRHPNVVTIYEVGRDLGQVYFTMDLIRGETLQRLIRSDALTPTQSVKILRQVASAIAYTHEQGIIHRDLKPLNILMDEAGKPYVTDFGLARNLDESMDLTRSGQVLGTPHYMSPEQARGESDRIAEPSDVWGLGAILYECLCGQPPFPGSSPIAVLHDLVHKSPKRPSKIKRSCPPALEAIVLKALEKEPKDRYPTARAFLEDLERFEQGRIPHADVSNPVLSLMRLGRRHSSNLLSGLAVAAILIATFVFTVLPRLGKDPETLRALADQLWEEGSIEAAATAYDASKDATLPPEIRNRIVAGRLAQTRRLRTEGRPAEALAILQPLAQQCEVWLQEDRSYGARSLDPKPRPALDQDQVVAVDVEILLSTSLTEGIEAAQGLLPSLDFRLRNDDCLFNRSPLASALFDHLDDESGPLKDWAIELLKQADDYDMRSSLFKLYPEHHEQLTLELLRLPELEVFRRKRDIVETITTVAATTVTRVLALAQDDRGSPAVRGLAASFLELALDLPQDRTIANDGINLDSDEVERILALAKQVIASDRIAAHWLRLDEAIRLIAAGRKWPRLWLAEFQIEPPELSGQALLDWWAEQPKTDPLPAAYDQTGLSPESNLAQFMNGLEAPDRQTRRAVHRLLRWRQGSDESWPLIDPTVAPSPEAWRPILLQDITVEENYECHAAAFRVTAGVIESEVADFRRVPLTVFTGVGPMPETVELNVSWEISVTKNWPLRIPGLIDVRASGTTRDHSATYQPTLVMNEPEIGFILEGTTRPFEDISGTLNLNGLWVGRVIEARQKLILGTQDVVTLFMARPASSAEPDFDHLDAWRRAAKPNLTDYIAKLEHEEDQALNYFVPPVLKLIPLLGLPESLDELRQIADLIGKRSGAKGPLYAHVQVGLLMSGDEATRQYFDERELPGQALGYGLPGSSGWTLRHIALNSPSEASRLWAQDKLSAAEIAEEEQAQLRHAHQIRPFVSKRLRHAIHGELAWSARWDRIVTENPEVFTLAIFLWLLVLGSLGIASVKRWRIKGAGLLVVAGAFMAIFEIEAQGLLLVPSWSGWLVAACGAGLLAPRIRPPHRYWPVGCFALAGVLQFLVSAESPWLASALSLVEGAAGLMILLLVQLYDEEFQLPKGHALLGALPLKAGAICIAGSLALCLILARLLGMPELAYLTGSTLSVVTIFWALTVYLRRFSLVPSLVPKFFVLTYIAMLLVLQTISWTGWASGTETPMTGSLTGASPFSGVLVVSYLCFIFWLFLLSAFGSFQRKRQESLLAEVNQS